MAANLDTVTARNDLKARNAPYWQKIDRGNHVGFRKLTSQSVGTWYARYNDTESGKRPKKTLGEFGQLPPRDRFSAAKGAADTWFKHLDKGGRVEPMTVRAACAAYAKHVREERGDDPADDLVGRYRRQVDESHLGKIELSKLTFIAVEKWRKQLSSTPALVSRDDRDDRVTRPRAKGTLNRDMTALRAALNYAHQRGHVTSDLAWVVALKPIPNADGQRDLYLDREQRRSLLSAAESDIRTFLHSLALLPLRPGALAQLKVAHFDARLSTLLVGKDKKGADRRLLLPKATATVFSAAALGKQQSEPLFSRANRAQWNKDSWKGPIKVAALAAGLPPATTAYTLRHSVITDLVSGGLDLLSIAKMSGTSVAMIEKHYGHLRKDLAAEALAALAL